ncbi:MAG TPA: hypothetical protein VEQ36_03990 [Thermomicrobiales bacterium]|nr:hypothetical protein [Thermomicrobiales bacterium]
MARRPDSGKLDAESSQPVEIIPSSRQAAAATALMLGLLLLIGTAVLIVLVLLIYAFAG